jgi:hypothetical protein
VSCSVDDGSGAANRRRFPSQTWRAVAVSGLLGPDVQARPMKVNDHGARAGQDLHLLLTDLDAATVDRAVVRHATRAGHEPARAEARKDAAVDEPRCWSRSRVKSHGGAGVSLCPSSCDHCPEVVDDSTRTDEGGG